MTKEFINGRLLILKDLSHLETKKFSSLYGKEYLEKIVSWFERALKEAH
tara:strand:+ start:291 stop:437 length:147 start_codon:yes stop_codon:yes gene_type:complete